MRSLSQGMDRPMTAMPRFTCSVLLVVVASWAAESRAQITPPLQPSTEHSYVVSQDRMRITDQEFGNEIRTNLPGMSLANVQSIVVLTQSCFSGGFIDELLALGGRVSVATSSRFNESTRNSFVIKWAQALLDTSTRFVETRQTFLEGSRRTLQEGAIEGTPEYGSTSLEADLTVIGAGYFTQTRQQNPNRQIVPARSLRILMWVGQETQNINSVHARWRVLKEAKEIARVGRDINVDTQIFYADRPAGFWIYDTSARQFVERTQAQFDAASDVDKREIVQVHGQGTRANFVDTLRRFAGQMNRDAQLFIVVVSHGNHNPHNPALGDRCPQVERTFIVNVTADETDGLPGDGICDTGGGARPLTGLCTLRAALREADDTPGLDEVRFNIPVADGRVPTIRPRGVLGSLGALFPVIIDGTTQPTIINGTRLRDGLVELDGSTAGLTPDGQELAGLELVGEGSTVRGLVINRFGGPGIRIRPTGAPFGGRNVIEDNRIGTDVTGTVALPNRGNGVEILDMPRNLVAQNLIAGNQGRGILIDGSAAIGNHIVENLIGADITGTTPLGNEQGGVVVVNDASQNLFGGNRIVSHSFGQLAIDLADNGVTVNDPGDGDAGANNLQNFPDLAFAAVDGLSTTVEGTLRSAPNASFLLEFFANRVCDPSGFGPGETPLGRMTVLTGGGGDASFAAPFPLTVPTTVFVTATATGPDGSTSEFSRCVPISSVPSSGRIAAIISQVESLSGLNQGEQNSLLSKLEAAQRSLSRGNGNAARGQLGAFMNEVQAFARSGRLDEATADSLIAQAQGVLDGI